jgi:hypothetical protein
MRIARLRPLVLLLWLAGCHTWARATSRPAPAPSGAIEGRARATRADGSVLYLVGARVDGDTLRGQIDAAPGERGPRAVAVPVDSVRRLDVRRLSVGRTAALGGGGVLVALALALAAIIAVLPPA